MEKPALYTDLEITATGSVSVKKYFNSIRRSLADKWHISKDRKYEDNHSFKILNDIVCFEAPKVQNPEKKIIAGYLHFGLTDDEIILLKVESSPELSGAEYIEFIGYMNFIFERDILSVHKYYTLFKHNYQFGGPNDENWEKLDLRAQKLIRLYSKAEQKTYVLSLAETVETDTRKISFNPPNIVSLSLNLMKKSYKRAGLLYKELIYKNKSSKFDIEKELTSKLYDYFEEIETSIIFAYISVEGLANAAIPEKFEYERVNEKGIKELWSKENIERWMTTSEKVSLILPKVLQSEDIVQQPFWSKFKELEKLRNDLVHQKTIEKGTKMDTIIFTQMLDNDVFLKIKSALKVIEFFNKTGSTQPYFPLGLGIAKFTIAEISSMEDHFMAIDKDED